MFVYPSIHVYSLILLSHFIRGLIDVFSQLNILPIWSFELIMHSDKPKSSSFKGRVIEQNYKM